MSGVDCARALREACPTLRLVLVTGYGRASKDQVRAMVTRLLPGALGEFMEMERSYPTSIFADNALYYRVRIHVDRGECSAAATTLGSLQAAYPTSNYVTRSESYIATGGC